MWFHILNSTLEGPVRSRIWSAIALASLISASSCVPATDVQKLLIKKTEELCQFEPTFATVVQLISAFGGPNAAPIDQIAKNICSLVKPSGALKSLPPSTDSFGKIRNVPVKGKVL